MYSGTLQVTVVSVVTVLVFLFLIEGNPLPVLRKILSEKIFAVYLMIMFAVIGIDIVELHLERVMEHLVTWDFTSSIYHMEGNLTAVLQSACRSQVLTNVASFFYVFVFPILVWVALAVFNRHDDRKMMKKLLLIFVFNYLIALPFYLFFPVNEAWFSRTGVELLIRNVYPGFDTQYRSLSGLNNCFPSLHTSLSASIALMSVHSGNRRLALVMSVSSAVIIFSTLYLGIHWFTDVMGGLVAAMLAVNLAIVMVDGSVPVLNKLKQTLNLLVK